MSSKYQTTSEIEERGRLERPAMPIKEALDSLNDRQKISVLAEDKNIRCLAGAGTGKTYVMTVRVANLISQGVRPRGILALSFTNESATELAQRVSNQSGFDGERVQISTFHSLFNNFLRFNKNSQVFKEKLGYPDGFFIIETKESDKLMDECLKALPNDLKLIFDALGIARKQIFKELTHHRAGGVNSSMLLRQIISNNKEYKISSWKSLMSITAGADNSEQIQSEVQKKLLDQPFLKDMLIGTIWKDYSKACKDNHAIDFDDILLFSLYLLKTDPDAAKGFCSQFSNILVDEWQDGNDIQLLLLKEIIKNNPNIDMFIVGDPKQAIYGFRESKVENMTEVEIKLSMPFSTYELEYNYRSTPKLIDVTNSFAAIMREQITDGQLLAGNKSLSTVESPISVESFWNAEAEAKHIADDIKEKLQSGIKPSEIYVMYRSRSAVKVLSPLLEKMDIPSEMIGEQNFYEREEIRDAMSFLRSLIRNKDTLAWARASETAKIGVSGTYIRSKSKEIENFKPRDFILSRKNARNKAAIDEFIGFHDNARDYLTNPAFQEVFAEENYPNNSKEEVINAINTRVDMKEAFENWRNKDIEEMVTLVGEKWIETAMPSYAKKDEKRALKHELTAEELGEARSTGIASLFREVSNRLQSGQLINNAIEDLMLRDTPTRKDREGTVKLMTCHASKGLQAKYVYAMGVETGIWSPTNDDDEKTMGENERLYYVMVTRAEQGLMISMAANRQINGEGRRSKPCQQLQEHLQALEKDNKLSHVTINDRANCLDAAQPNSSQIQAPSHRGNQSSNALKNKIMNKMNSSNNDYELGQLRM